MALGDMVQVYRNRRMAALVGLGFASGLPNVLMVDTLNAWLSAIGIDVASIGLFSLIGLPYALKFLWAPFMDRSAPPGLSFLGRRKGWLILTQVSLIFALAILAACGPEHSSDKLLGVTIVGVCIVFLSASQDIVADAYRTDVLETSELGAGAAVFVSGYRIATIVGGACALILAKHVGWHWAYFAMAALMGFSLLATAFAPQPHNWRQAPLSLNEAVVQPMAEFVRQRGTTAFVVLAFVIVFRLPDFLAASMTMPLLIKHLQFTTEEIGWIRQMLGFFLTIIGALLGGSLVARLGLMRSLIVFGLLQTLSNAGFMILANVPHNLPLMATVIAVESFCGGLVQAGFVAFLMSCCDRRYSATQFAVFTALMAVAQKLGGATSGYLVEQLGYFRFFAWTIAAGVPGLVLLPWLPGRAESPDESEIKLPVGS